MSTRKMKLTAVPDAKMLQGGSDVPEQVRLALYKVMVEARYCEKRAHDLFLQNLVKGTSHLALGQEAVRLCQCDVRHLPS